jgi:acyl-CoA hydrolase
MVRAETAAEAVKLIKSGDHIHIHSAASTPQILVDAMVARHEELSNIEIFHLHTEGYAPYIEPEYADSFHLNSMFIAGNVRKAINDGRADFIPVFLSEVPIMYRRKILPIDVALIQVSPPDKHGYCSYGIGVEATKAAVEMADSVIAHVNPNMPRTHGDSLIHKSEIDIYVDADLPVLEHKMSIPGEVEHKIGGHIASLVEDGATLQMGIGSIPDAALAALENHKDLGIHTEMFSDGIIPLVEKGVINGKNKSKQKGIIISGFCLGTRRLYDFVDDNPVVRLMDIQYVNDTAIIRRNPKVTSINSAIEVDITGQVCADSIGSRMYSGVGGQMDFIRGASLSEGGKPIIALPSVTKSGESKIVMYLKQGAGVVTTRAHVHYIVTEYGVADLYAKTLRQRAQALIDIAHPDHRESLEKECFSRFSDF